MRSSVSAILSDPAPDNTMSFPDYSQSSSDHATLLVLCQHIGHQLEPRTYSQVVAAISQVTSVKVADKSGLVRCVRVRYADRYPAENNEWGEFQAHRRVLGVVTVGAATSPQELAELCRLHESCRAKYHATVFDTRCVVFCSHGDSEVISDTASTGEENEDKNDEPPKWFNAHSHKTQLLQYHGDSYHAPLNADIQDFISSLFWILESKRVEATRDTSDKIPLLCAPFERKDFVGLDMESRNNRKRVLGRLKKHLGDLSLQAGLLAEAWNYYQVAGDVLRPANDWLWLAASLEGLCAVSVCLQEAASQGQSLGSRGLGDQDMVEKYREAVIHYGKYKHAGIIETEASIKAVMVLISQGNFLLAAEFLQNIVFINLQMNDAEKIARFLALSDLYQQIGFHRKSAFYKRVAAMRCVAPQNPAPDWAACYQLMVAAVPGYGVQLAAAGPPEHGWPALQVQLLQELVGTSRKMGAATASTRHMTYLLQHMFPVLADTERKDFAGQLSILATAAGARNEQLSLESLSLDLPPIPLHCLPSVTKFSPQPLEPHLVPHPRKSSPSVPSGPFLFTPIQNIGGGSARSSGRAKPRPVTWVAGEAGAVVVEVTNPLCAELAVPRVSLVTGGVAVQQAGASLVLPPRSGPTKLSLAVTAQEAGQLSVLGYTHTALGLTSECHLEESHALTVLPPLPLVTTSLELSLGGVWVPVLTSPLHLYSGETLHFRLTVRNVGVKPVGELEVECSFGEAPGSPPPLVTVHTDTIASSLPLAPGGELQLALEMTGLVDTATLKQEEDNLSSASDSRWNFSLASSSVRSSLTTPAPTGHPSLASCTSAGSGGSCGPVLTSLHSLSLQLQYSGEAGAEHCRRAVQQVSLVQTPSLLVTRWDVLPGDTQHNCFLVLDLVNRTHVEMELQYTERKTLLIEPGDMCRVPVPVTKCSFSESLEWAGGRGVAEYLASCVRLAWSINTQDTNTGDEITRVGTASLDNITWTDAMLDLIRRPPLVSSVSINGEAVVEGGEVEHLLGEVLTLNIQLSNQLLEPVCDCGLAVKLLQEGAGRAGGGAGGGAGEVVPGQQLTHATTLLPLTPGSFKLSVSSNVTFRGRPHSWRLAPITINIKT